MTTIKLRRDPAALWTQNNPVLALAEKGVETDTRKEKIGDGVTAWNALPYSSGGELPAGSVMAVKYITSWPVRPTTRTDITVFWLGGTTQPSGMLSVDVWLPVASTTTPDDTTAPTVPAGLSNSGTTSSTLTFSWSASTDAVGVTGYEVRLNAGTAVAKASNELSHTFTGLTAGTQYTATVRARDAAGNFSAWSSGVVGTPTASSDTTPPSVPTGLSSSAITATSFTLSYSAATDSVGVTGYEVRVNNGTAVAKGAGVLSHTFTGLTASTAYSAQVRARDAAGNFSAWSTALVVNTSAGSSTLISVLDETVLLGGATPTNNNDLTTGGATAGIFYSTVPWRIKGGRIWIPSDFPDAALGQTVTFRAHVLDYTGGSVIGSISAPTAVAAGRTATATIDGKGKWISATFSDTVIDILGIASGAAGSDVGVISAQIDTGTRYVAWPVGARAALATARSAGATDSSIPHNSSVTPKLYLAETTLPSTPFFNAGAWTGGTNSTIYGVDVLAEFI